MVKPLSQSVIIVKPITVTTFPTSLSLTLRCLAKADLVLIAQENHQMGCRHRCACRGEKGSRDCRDMFLQFASITCCQCGVVYVDVCWLWQLKLPLQHVQLKDVKALDGELDKLNAEKSDLEKQSLGFSWILLDSLGLTFANIVHSCYNSC